MPTDINTSGTAVAYAIGIPLVLLLVAIEAIVCSVRGWQYYKRDDTLGSLGLLAGNVIVNGALKATALAFSFYLYQFRVFEINKLLPVWAVWLLCFVAIDFVFYWYHRASHRVRCLWAVHMNHHCSQELNFVVAFRQAWLGPVTKVPFFAVLPLVGFDPTITLTVGVASTLWGVVGHTRIVNKFWWPIEFMMNTPSHHRVHHGSNAQYIDKNYGNLFIIWDRLFGTFEPEVETVAYGLRTNLETHNPFTITIYDWSALFRTMRQSPNWKVALQYVFAPPGWRHNPTAREQPELSA